MVAKMLSLAAACVVLFVMVGCTVTGPAANSPLIGTWNLTKQMNSYSSGSKDTITAGALFSNKYTFSDDYSLSGTTVLLGINISFTGTWSEKGDMLTLNQTMMGTTTSSSYQYAVSGGELTLTYSKVEGSVTKTTVEKYSKQ
jgi:hypothetical protein